MRTWTCVTKKHGVASTTGRLRSAGVDSSDRLMTDPRGIMGQVSTFYSAFYAQRADFKGKEEIFTYLQDAGFQSRSNLSEEDVLTLMDLPTEEEVKAALGKGSAKSAPGPDGLPYGVYRSMADLFIPLLMKLFQEMWSGEAVGNSFWQGVMMLLYKGGDPTRIENWRPITINNTDYRILTRLINSRI